MLRKTLLILLVLGMAGPVSASTWAEALFDELSYDFGSVPSHQMLVHPFRIVNNTKNTVRIVSARAGCSCTTARALATSLAPGQETAVLAQMDTRRFSGVRAVTIYVLFDSPRFEEVRLAVQANSRSELVFAPENLTFPKIKRGATPTTQMTITFLGSPQLQVTEVKCDSNYIQPKFQELRRDASEVIYQVSATIRADVPEGKWFTDVWLTTNNPTMAKLRVPLTVEIEAPPAPTPAPGPAPTKATTNIVLEPVHAGKEEDRKVILRGTQPFRITGILGADKEIIVRPVSNDSQAVHELTLTFRPGQVGPVNRLIRVTTDMSNNKEIEFNAQTQIVP